ncbi:FAD-dependent oxidoreductase [Nocardia colli]|uniref:FAD-dependent oxidoreductase n=1 Tax=Nocardia colli TaxID=2545717 RepID=UPI001CC7CD51|nr:FAD-dependent oxidoreductase [Nocardia colli]
MSAPPDRTANWHNGFRRFGGRTGMLSGPPLIEIREPGRAARRLMLSGPVTFGRNGDNEQLADTAISPRHLRLVPSPTALSVVDLGSRTGTTVNGVPLTGRTALTSGDTVQLGDTEIIVLYDPVTEPLARIDEETPSEPPTAPTPVAPPPTRLFTLANRILDIDPDGKRNLFPAATEIPSRMPRKMWHLVRIASIAVYLEMIVAMFVRPAGGLFVFFGVVVPLLPGLFLIAPGLWRNSCPLAATNQIPRVLRFTRGKNPPDWLYARGYLGATTLFFGIAGARLAGLDRNGVAAGTVLLLVLIAAFTGGFLFKGKSGWCSSICPLFPLQRAYGQTPFVTVPNSHCEPCVGCAKNCFDLKPRSAYQADLTDPELAWSAPRKLFAAALPGFVLGFFTLAGRTETSLGQRYSVLALFMVVAVGLFFALDAMTPLSIATISVGYSALALNIFYWFAAATLARSFGTVTGLSAPWLHWPISAFILLATIVWIARTRVVELQFALSTGARTEPVLLALPKVRPKDVEKPSAPAASVSFDGVEVAADGGMSLLDVAERGKQEIEAGCRMGVCGADPVAVLDGMSCLSPPGQDERNTLRRLGFADNTRMACCARISGGAVKVSLTPEPGNTNRLRPTRFDRSIVSVAVIGNGIAGVTAADFLRRNHPDCEIHLVGRESHPLYNRMGISRLVYGRSAMQGLHLLPEQWYDDHQITTWLNTLATSIDLAGRRVFLGTGEALPYDRLILAMGASSALPPIEGLSRPGCFVLREASDAIWIRSYAQQFRCATAVVAGGGLLGLEAAHALHLLGLHVTVLERGDRLLGKQIDARCSQLVLDHFARTGIQVLRHAETESVTGDPAVRRVVLRDGGEIDCDLFLTATGIRPNIDLARSAGVPVERGVLVDDRMRTRVPDVYAAGDIAELGGQVFGLWPIAAEQAQVAAVNALGDDRPLAGAAPAMILKGVGLELFSTGKVEPEFGDEVIVLDRSESYRRLILSHGRVVGATVLGHHPGDLAAAQQALGNRLPVPVTARDALYAGDWSMLAHLDSEVMNKPAGQPVRTM